MSYQEEQHASIQFLTTGKPDPELLSSLKSSLIDVTVHVETESESRSAAPLVASVVVVALGAVLTLGGIGVFFILRESRGGTASLSPDHGPAGSAVVVNGSSYESFAVISIDTRIGDNYETIELAEDQADDRGRFTLSITIPSEAEPGYIDLDLSAHGDDVTEFDDISFAVTR